MMTASASMAETIRTAARAGDNPAGNGLMERCEGFG